MARPAWGSDHLSPVSTGLRDFKPWCAARCGQGCRSVKTVSPILGCRKGFRRQLISSVQVICLNRCRIGLLCPRLSPVRVSKYDRSSRNKNNTQKNSHHAFSSCSAADVEPAYTKWNKPARSGTGLHEVDAVQHAFCKYRAHCHPAACTHGSCSAWVTERP